MTAVLSGWFNEIPVEANLKLHQKITSDIEPFLLPCECGGRFTSEAKPRCPKCDIELSAIETAGFIENNAPGTETGWRWQRSWNGIYCIVIEKKMIEDNWKK
jgi:hypothetical protein